ncbi:MAG TPA: chromate resistance protein ChrB domain-containing protein [Tepidiformaceae bacterium]|nr:chromate resistance protein ChrB domain-containing protein [Tepidiformaceae bacterium]
MANESTDLSGQPWLLLIHQIPPKPDYFRVKIGRRLARVGAVAIKNSVYVLPATDQCMEDLQWILREITEGGGDASICRSTFVDGLTDGEIERLFHVARSRDYEDITAHARATLKALKSGRRLDPEQRASAEQTVARLRKRLATVARVDYFGAERRDEAAKALDLLEARLRPPSQQTSRQAAPTGQERPRGHTWVTRESIFVDRIASAWLIRRFIDPEARFRFVPPERYRPKRGELRFDMFEAEYTHEGDRCTFETLLRRFELEDPALLQIAEVVHDIDLKDDKFGREDAAGIERVLAGIAAACVDDDSRLERGAVLFDDLYALAMKDYDRARVLHER